MGKMDWRGTWIDPLIAQGLVEGQGIPHIQGGKRQRLGRKPEQERGWGRGASFN